MVCYVTVWFNAPGGEAWGWLNYTTGLDPAPGCSPGYYSRKYTYQWNIAVSRPGKCDVRIPYSAPFVLMILMLHRNSSYRKICFLPG